MVKSVWNEHSFCKEKHFKLADLIISQYIQQGNKKWKYYENISVFFLFMMSMDSSLLFIFMLNTRSQ